MNPFHVAVMLGLIHVISVPYLEVVAGSEIYFHSHYHTSQRSWFVNITKIDASIKLILWDINIPYSQNCTDCYLRIGKVRQLPSITLTPPLCNDNTSSVIKERPLTWITSENLTVDFFCKDVILSQDAPVTFFMSHDNVLSSNYTCGSVLWDENLQCWNFSATIYTRGDTAITCSWEIQGKSVNSSFQVSFQDFNLVSTKDCQYDYVQIDDKSNAIKQICVYDTTVLENIMTTGPAINITLFVSNDTESTDVTDYVLLGIVKEIAHVIKRKVEGVILLSEAEGRVEYDSSVSPSFVLRDSVNTHIWDVHVRPGLQITISWNTNILSVVRDSRSVALFVLDKISHRNTLIDLTISDIHNQSLTFNTFHLEITMYIFQRVDGFQLEILYSTSPVKASNVLVNSLFLPTTTSVKDTEPQQQVSQSVWKFKAFDAGHYLRFEVNKLIISASLNCFDSCLYLYDGDNINVSKLYGPFCKNNFPLSSFTSSGSFLTVVYLFSVTNSQHTDSVILEFGVTEDHCKGVTLGDSVDTQIINEPICYNIQYLSPAYTSADLTNAQEGIHFKINSRSLFVAHMKEINSHESACSKTTGYKCKQYLFFDSMNNEVFCKHSNPCLDGTIPCVDHYRWSLTEGLEFYIRLRSSCFSSPISLTANLIVTDTPLDSSFCSRYNNCQASQILKPCGLLLASNRHCQYNLGLFDKMFNANEQKFGYQHFILQIHNKNTYSTKTDIVISEVVHSSVRNQHGVNTRIYSHESKLDNLCDDQIGDLLPSVFRYPTIASDDITVTMNDNIASVEFQLVQLHDPVKNNFLCRQPDGYYYYNGYCYKFTLQFHEQKHNIPPTDVATWNGAERACKKDKGELISLLSEEEEQFVLDMLSTHWMRTAYGDGAYVAVFIGLKEKENGELRWTDGLPLTFTKWYRPDRRGEMYTEEQLNGFVNDLLHVISPDDIQPVRDEASKCTVMIVRNPFIGSRWAKIPCDFPLSISSYICKVPAIETFNATNHIDPIRENHQPRLNIQCPSKWTNFANKCYLLITSENNIGVPLTYNNASDLCSNYGGRLANISDKRLIDSIKLLQLWRHRPEYGTILIEKAGEICRELRGSYPNDEFQNFENKLLLKCPEMTWRIHTTSCNDSVPHHWSFYTHNSYLTPISVLCERELYDMTPSCSDLQFECADGSCINGAWICDGQKDCPKGEDEQNCDSECGSLFFRCNNNDCVPMSGYCDFVPHCLDESDETNCVYPKCTEHEFRCGNGKCIDLNKTCDFVADCADSADESEKVCNWAETCIRRGGFACYDGKCLPKSVKHNLKMDCKGKTQEDETYNELDYKRGEVGHWVITPKVTLVETPFCGTAGALESRCHTNQPECFDRYQACIFDVDWQNQVKGCGDLYHLNNCGNFTCPGYFKCPNSYCIPLHRICNGDWDCLKGEDEANCQNFTCPGNVRCKGENWCLDQNRVCDGQVDCKKFQDDEMFCELGNTCSEACSCRGYTINCTNGRLTNLPHTSRFMRTILFGNNSLNLTRNTLSAHYYVGYLDLSYNGINVIVPHAFADMYNLLVLILVGNSIRVLDNSPFYNLRLTYLDLRDNALENIAAGAFRGLEKVGTMDLEGNYEYLIINDKAFRDISIYSLRTDAPRFCCSAPNNISCTPEPDEFSSCEDLMSNYVLRVSIWILGIIACLGNLFVIVWRLKYDRKKVGSFLIIHLSVSDFLMGIYLLIIAGADMYYAVQRQYYLFDPIWRQGTGCQIAGFLASLSSEMSVTMLLLITIDRFIIIVIGFQVKHISMKQARIITLIGWSFWILISALPFMTIPYFGVIGNFYGRTAVCLPFTLSRINAVGLEYAISIFLVFNFLAFLVIAILYVAIFFHTSKTRKSSGRNISERDLDLAKRIALIVATDFFCWIPIIIATIMARTGSTMPLELSAWMAVFVLPINSALNPVFYTIASLDKSQILALLKKQSESRNIYITGTESAGHNSTAMDIRSNIDHSRNMSSSNEDTRM